jgi:proline iminopeptidase
MAKTVELTGGRVASYEVVGSGRPTLMFPGGPGFAAAYMRTDADLFADVFESYLIDPHGSGASTPPKDSSRYSPEGHAAFYDEVRKALGLDHVLVLGHSFGGTTALAYTALFPSAVDACIAVAAFGIGTEVDGDEGGTAEEEFDRAVSRHEGAAWFPEAKSTMDSWTESVLAAEDAHEIEQMMATVLPLYTAHPDRPDVARRLAEMKQHLTADLAAAKAWEGGLYQTIDLRPLASKIARPTLVVAGELDFICGPAQARPISDAIVTSNLEVIRDCGHIPSIEAPDEYRSAVLRFVEKN